ncbi:MAG: hypothetical protein HUJ77_13940 [Clostridium sp.]|uniref:hypothetical protein n=1 Tax=Clostridium sp. TaxID=1506 RepID=UPI0025C041DB|nr:hypothetical protein [Clostridium sp.]MCF0149480.1 hypothetical protein [Clostridium sp.]
MFKDFYTIDKDNYKAVTILKYISLVVSFISFLYFIFEDTNSQSINENSEGHFFLSLLLLFLAIYFTVILRRYKKNI